MMGGNVFTYYGEEIGMVGSSNDPNKRIAMNWSETERTNPPPGARCTVSFWAALIPYSQTA